MKIIGLTGGIGMGKSTAARFMRCREVEVLDTDQIARNLVEPGRPALAEIQEAFGPEIVDEQGRLRRGALAQRVFENADRRKILESILHPRIRVEWKRAVDAWRGASEAGWAAVEIPLLFEVGAEAEFDAVVCVACSRKTQQLRLRERGWTDEQIENRRQSQWPVERKMELSHFVIWTEGEAQAHEAQLSRILSRI